MRHIPREEALVLCIGIGSWEHLTNVPWVTHVDLATVPWHSRLILSPYWEKRLLEALSSCSSCRPASGPPFPLEVLAVELSQLEDGASLHTGGRESPAAGTQSHGAKG